MANISGLIMLISIADLLDSLTKKVKALHQLIKTGEVEILFLVMN